MKIIHIYSHYFQHTQELFFSMMIGFQQMVENATNRQM